MALNSMDVLKYKYTEVKNVMHEIVEKLPKDNPFHLQIMMLQLELDNYSSQELPEELALLLKKFCWIFQSYLKIEKQIELPVIKRFINEPYHHNEIEKIIQLGFECLIEFNQIIDEKPEEVIPEIEIKV
jgi:hypothetical protein